MENKNCKNTKDAQNTQNNTQTSGIAGKAAESALRGLVVCFHASLSGYTPSSWSFCKAAATRGRSS